MAAVWPGVQRLGGGFRPFGASRRGRGPDSGHAGGGDPGAVVRGGGHPVLVRRRPAGTGGRPPPRRHGHRLRHLLVPGRRVRAHGGGGHPRRGEGRRRAGAGHGGGPPGGGGPGGRRGGGRPQLVAVPARRRRSRHLPGAGRAPRGRMARHRDAARRHDPREGVRRDRGRCVRRRGRAHAGALGDARRGRRARRRRDRDPDAGEARRRQRAGATTAPPDLPQSHPVRPRRARSLPGAVSVGTLVRRQSYRDLLVGQAVSALGDWMGTVAFMALTLAITGSPAAVGGILALRLIPAAIGGPLAARAASRWDRRRTMLTMDAARAGMIALVPLVRGLWWIYLWAFLVEVASLVFLPARDASIPDVVDRDDLPLANGLILGSSYGSIPLGAAAFAAVAALPGSDLGGRTHALVIGIDALQRASSGDAIQRTALGTLVIGLVVAVFSLSPGLWAAYLGAVGFGAAAAFTLAAGMGALQSQLDGHDRFLAFAAFHVVIRVALSLAAVGAGLAGAALGAVTWPVIGRLEPSRVVLLCSGLLVVASAAAVRERRRAL